jgi:microcystin-dependent protein
MAEPFIGEIRIFPYTFAPEDWAKCEGQELLISDHTALFSLVGDKYGGNGTTTFGIPDYRGKVPFCWGTAPWQDYAFAAKGGVETHTLPQVPSHRHNMFVQVEEGTEREAADHMIASEISKNGGSFYAYKSNTTLHPGALASVGSATPVPYTNIMPYQALSFCIALDGYYPPRS